MKAHLIVLQSICTKHDFRTIAYGPDMQVWKRDSSIFSTVCMRVCGNDESNNWPFPT